MDPSEKIRQLEKIIELERKGREEERKGWEDEIKGWEDERKRAFGRK